MIQRNDHLVTALCQEVMDFLRYLVYRPNCLSMWQHYLRSTLRSLRKKKAFTIINVTGLAAGLAICLLIVLFVTDELGYDRYNRNADRVFRVNTDLKFGTTRTAFANSAPPVADALVKHYPE